MPTTFRTFAAAAVAVLIGVFGLAGCGDDDELAAAGERASEAFCEARVDLESAFMSEDMAGVETALGTMESEAPDDAADQATTVAEAIRDNPERLFMDEDVAAARLELDEVVLDQCDFEVVEVTARDYEFDGVPDSLDAGTTAFRLSNEGSEVHEILVVKVPDDLDEPAADFVDRIDAMFEGGQEEEAMGLIQMVTASFAPPGESDIGIGRLTEGNYIAVCFVPVGSTSEDVEADGPPHYHEGMITEFTVS